MRSVLLSACQVLALDGGVEPLRLVRRACSKGVLNQAGEYHPVRDEQARHNEGGDQPGGAEVWDRTGVGQRVDQIGDADDAEDQGDRDREPPAGSQRDQGKDRKQAAEKVAIRGGVREARRDRLACQSGDQEGQPEMTECVRRDQDAEGNM